MARPGRQRQNVTTTGSGHLFVLAGSLWMAEDDPTGFGACLLERFDLADPGFAGEDPDRL